MTHAAAGWQALQGAITRRVILQGSPGYETARMPAMARFANVRPAAVVPCTTPADVAETITFARRFGLKTAVRGGGHSVAGHSSTEGIIIDVTPMNLVSVAGSVAAVGAGTRLGGLYDALAGQGRAIPVGCGSSVGIAGLTLGGGIGVLGRKDGLTCDQLLRAEVVLADGRIIESSEHAEEELFGRCAAPAVATLVSSPRWCSAPCRSRRPPSSTWSGRSLTVPQRSRPGRPGHP